MIIITLHLVSIKHIPAYSERYHVSSTYHITFIKGESQRSSLLQHLQEQLTNKNMNFYQKSDPIIKYCWSRYISCHNTIIHYVQFSGESGLVYKAYINTAIGRELVAVKTGKGIYSTSI